MKVRENAQNRNNNKHIDLQENMANLETIALTIDEKVRELNFYAGWLYGASIVTFLGTMGIAEKPSDAILGYVATLTIATSGIYLKNKADKK